MTSGDGLYRQVVDWVLSLDKVDAFLLGMIAGVFLMLLITLALPPEPVGCTGSSICL